MPVTKRGSVDISISYEVAPFAGSHSNVGIIDTLLSPSAGLTILTAESNWLTTVNSTGNVDVCTGDTPLNSKLFMPN